MFEETAKYLLLALGEFDANQLRINDDKVWHMVTSRHKVVLKMGPSAQCCILLRKLISDLDL